MFELLEGLCESLQRLLIKALLCIDRSDLTFANSDSSLIAALLVAANCLFIGCHRFVEPAQCPKTIAPFRKTFRRHLLRTDAGTCGGDCLEALERFVQQR